MLTEDYVSFEVAKLLKEKGFDEKCRASYNKDGNFLLHKSCYFQLECGDGYLAPTHQMACKWLREVHNIFITVYLFDREKPFTENSLYTCDIATNKMSSQQGHLRGIWTTYEVAVEATIKYVLENLI